MAIYIAIFIPYVPKINPTLLLLECVAYMYLHDIHITHFLHRPQSEISRAPSTVKGEIRNRFNLISEE